MTTVEYTDHFSDAFSSVISQAWRAANGDVYVEFHNGRLAGYRNVPASVFRDWKSADSSGQFYNGFIKNLYTGIDTNGVIFKNAMSASPAQVAPAAKVTVGTSKWDVIFENANDKTEVTFTTNASSEHEAVVEAQTFAQKINLPLSVVRTVHYF